jgi:hypothetical protein
MKKFKWVVEIEIDETWVADGYEAKADRVKDAILNYSLGYAYDHEVNVKVLKAPSKDRIKKAQGYPVKKKKKAA